MISATYTGIDANINMALPHSSFWMEASPDMPFVLKEEVVVAYYKLHYYGIIHGNPQLRNMLICADGSVKLVDFQACRALDALPAAGILSGTRADIDLEMRQVKFKLDYAGAHQYEFDKRDRAHDIEMRNKERARLRKLQFTGKYDGEVEDDEHYVGDDAIHPPIPDPFWQEHWIDDIDCEPRRFVAPGQTEEELRDALEGFENVVADMFKNYDERMLVGLQGPQPGSAALPLEDEEMETVHIGRYYMRRRKRAESETSDVCGPTKTREGKDEELQRHIREANAEAAAATEYPFPSRVSAKAYDGRAVGMEDYGYDLPRASSSFTPSKGPIVRDYGAVVPPSQPLQTNPYPRTSWSADSCVNGGDLLRASSSTVVETKPMKVVDYAARPYHGFQGYYVPHPPTEIRAGIERVRHIRETNRETADKMGFGPYYAKKDNYCIPPSYKRPPSDRPWYTAISLGKLKRRREKDMDREEHEDYPHVPKRQKVEDAQAEALALQFIRSHDHIQLVEPSLRTSATGVSRISSRGSKRPVRDPETGKLVPVPILKAPRPREFRKLPSHREFWTGEREPCLSPKLGPPRLPVARDESRAILGAFVYPALPYFHMRQLTSELKRTEKARKDKTADSTAAPPPLEALASPPPSGSPAEAEAEAQASGSVSQEVDGAESSDEDKLEDDSAPYWPPVAPYYPPEQTDVPTQAPPAPPAQVVRRRLPIRMRENVPDPETIPEEFGRTVGLMAIGRPSVIPRRRRHSGSHYPAQPESLLSHYFAAGSLFPPAPSSSSEPARERPAPGPSRPSASRRRQATPGPSRSVASGPAVVRGRPDVLAYGQGATYSVPRLPGSSPDQHRAKRRRTHENSSSHSTYGSSSPPPAPLVVKQESDDDMVIDEDEDERRPCVTVPTPSKSYWQSLVGWFTRSG